jgi:hypothetical protein
MTSADFADLAVRGTAWLAMTCYFLGAFLLLQQTHGARPRFHRPFCALWYLV